MKISEIGLNNIKGVNKYYDKAVKDCETFLTMYRGGEYIKTEEFLFPNSKREDIDDYNERKKRAFYSNFPESIIGIYRDGIYQNTKIVREDNKDEGLKAFWANIDKRGNSAQVFMSDYVFDENQIYGLNYVLVDVMRISTENKPEVTSQNPKNAKPYAIRISPSAVRSWGLDAFGRYEWVVIEEDVKPYIQAGDLPADTRIKSVLKVWTNEEWAVFEKSGTAVIKPTTHNAGIVPLISIFNKPDPMTNGQTGISYIESIKGQTLYIYNLNSRAEQISHFHLIPLLLVDATTADALFKDGKSVHNVLIVDEDGVTPSYAVVDYGALKEIRIEKADTVHEIYDISKVRQKNIQKQTESGVAKFHDSQDESNVLYRKAMKMEKAETDMLELYYRWTIGAKPGEEFKAPEGVFIKYPPRYDVETLNDKIADATSIAKLNLGSRLGNQKIAFDIYKSKLGNLDDKTFDKIKEEIANGFPGTNVDELLNLASGGVLKKEDILIIYKPDLSESQATAEIKANIQFAQTGGNDSDKLKELQEDLNNG